ncbi:hypothetical protein [Robiginitomaculum antarcticum]|uniref:hypothetical protein n=1 Tax=Robiginitomaculum antarcticum TaxID=437507 RepID=UPI000475771B|nr:hypothetical protein [Robiginitomaculum antarcticum]
MPELMRTFVSRAPQKTSPEKHANTMYATHAKNLRSKFYNDLSKLCETSASDEILNEAAAYLKNDNAVSIIEDLPEILQAPLKAMEHKNYEFVYSDVSELINGRKRGALFGDDFEQGHICPTSPYFEARTRLEDTLLMRSLVPAEKPEINLQRALKGILYLEKAYKAGRARKDINIRKHFEKPILLDSCLLSHDPCKERPQDGGHSLPVNEHKPCDCADNGECPDECCECECDNKCVEQDPCCTKLVPHIGELFIIRDDVYCYEAKEIAKIVSVMESEYREVTHRRLKREELYSETQTEISTQEETTHQVEKATTLRDEMDKAIDRDLSLNTSSSFTYGGDKIPYSATASVDVSSNTSRRDAQRIAKETSTRILDRAVKQVNKKMKSLTSRRLTHEIEETNVHKFGAPDGALKDMSRTFHEVVEKREAQMYSAGIKGMLQINFPEPSAHFFELLQIDFDLEAPEIPSSKPFNCSEFTVENYQEIAGEYGASATSPPEMGPVKYLTYRGKKGDSIQVTVPDGYTATKMDRVASYLYRPNGLRKGHVAFSLDGDNVAEWKGKNTSDRNSTSISVRGQATATITGTNYNNNSWIEVRLTLTPDPVDLKGWKEDLCEQIKEAIKKKEDAYVRDVDIYEEAKAQHKIKQTKLVDERINKSNFALSEVIKENIAHHAKTVIACNFFDIDNGMRNRVQPCGLPQMNFKQTKKYARVVDLLERCFDWQFMSYMLYGQSHAQKCKWKELAQRTQSKNTHFQKFLNAGFGTAIIPIKEGAEFKVNYFLATGLIWDDEDQPPIPGKAFADFFQELKEAKGNYSTDRDGFVIHDTSYMPTLDANQVVLQDNADYYDDSVTPAIFDTTLAEADFNREIFIDKKVYRILAIDENSNGDVVITLDKGIPVDSYDNPYPWATGFVFSGINWIFDQATPHAWLRENMRCLPCTYPIECEEVE